MKVTMITGTENWRSRIPFDGEAFGVGFRNFGTVFKISPAGALSTLHCFTGGSDGAAR